MNRLFPAALFSCAAAFLSNPAWSFQGFDFFEQIEQSIECVRKPGTDYLVCTNKWTPADSDDDAEDSADTTEEPVVDTTPEPTPDSEPAWDLYNRERVYFDDSQISMDGCADPSKNLVYLNLDVDLDGDQDVIFGFTCFEPVTDTEYLRQHVTYDEFYGWIADQYLAVFINNDGVFENDQSIFGGEYPVFDTTLKAWNGLNVGDVNGDGYDDVLFQHHWDNSVFDIVNGRAFNIDRPTDVYYNNAGSVMLSDGEGGYVTHMLPFQSGQTIPSFYTDNLGDTYLWLFGTRNAMPRDWVDAYEARTLDLDVGPLVARVEGAELVDVTDRYWELQDNLPSGLWIQHCWVQRGMAVNGEYPIRPDRPEQPGCLNEANQIIQDYSQVNFQGETYINVLGRKIQEEFWDIQQTDPRLSECEHLINNSGNQELYEIWEDCKLEVMSGPWEIESLLVYSMDTDDGIYVSNRTTAQGEYRFYDIPEEHQRGQKVHYQYFLNLGEQYLLSYWDWGLTIADNGADVAVMLNMPGALLDPGVEIDDLSEFFEYAINERPDTPGEQFNGNPQTYLEIGSNMWSIMDSGFCIDFIDTVEPEDCDNPDWWTQNRVDRFATRETEHGRSLAYRVSKTDGVIVPEPKLTNFNMAFNPFRSQLIDFDGDGDLDYYLNDYNMECGAMCYYENAGDFELVLDLDGIWGQADAEFWAWQSVVCAGPQRPDDGFWNNTLCDLPYSLNDTQVFLQPASGNVTISDINGDGIYDFYAVKNEGYIEIIYGE